jgi:hypothetical protein
MRRRGLLALAVLLLGAPADAPAQPANSQASQIPPEVPAPSDEARAFFETLSTHVLTDELLTTAIERMPGGSAAPVDEIIEPLFARGERVPAWESQGIDLHAIVAARPGGLAGNMLQSENEFGPSFSYYVDLPIEAFIPSNWVLVGRRGAPVAGNVAVEVGRISPKVILVQRVSYQRRGRAYCEIRTESRLYADRDVQATEADMISVFMAMRILQRGERTRVCQSVIELESGRYGARVFDAEGYRLPAIEQMVQPMRIVPFAQPR